MNMKALAAARAATQERRARGEKIERLNPIEKATRDPKSRPKALRAYFHDLNLVEQNRGLEGVSGNELASAARAQLKACLAQHGNSRVRAIKALCENCVGGTADPGMRDAVRGCGITECPLHAVRPHQAPKRRARPET